ARVAADTRLQVRDVVSRRLRLDDTARDPCTLGVLETNVGEVVERLVVQTPDIGDQACAELRLVRRRRRAAARHGHKCRNERRDKRDSAQRDETLPHLTLLFRLGSSSWRSYSPITTGDRGPS